MEFFFSHVKMCFNAGTDGGNEEWAATREGRDFAIMNNSLPGSEGLESLREGNQKCDPLWQLTAGSTNVFKNRTSVWKCRQFLLLGNT